MNNRVAQIALRICLLREEYSEREIAEAVKLLQAQGSPSSLLNYLAGRKPSDATSPKDNRQTRKAIDKQRSRAVLRLEGTDQLKFELLSEFDRLVREGIALPELDDIKRVGQRLSKDFVMRGSRKDAISKLMGLIADRPLDEMREIIRSALSSSRSRENGSEYHDLASFIISGKPSQ